MAEAVGLISSVITILAVVNEGLKSVKAVRCASEDFERLQVTFKVLLQQTAMFMGLSYRNNFYNSNSW